MILSLPADDPLRIELIARAKRIPWVPAWRLTPTQRKAVRELARRVYGRLSEPRPSRREYVGAVVAGWGSGLQPNFHGVPGEQGHPLAVAMEIAQKAAT